MFKKVYTFDDVALVPQFNNVNSRLEPDLKTWLTQQTKIGIPLIPANMDTVISEKMADILIKNYSGKPIFHRFASLEQKITWNLKYGKSIYISCGVKNTDIEEIDSIYQKTGIKFAGICFDIAHGHSSMMLDAIAYSKKLFGDDCEIISGNVCTAEACQDLYNAGSSAIKVGVGSGAACLTRMVTGFGVSQFSAICDCAKICNKLRIPIIADGGIRNSRDVVLSLAAGASSVMIGKLFAQTFESAGPKTEIDNEIKDPTKSCRENRTVYTKYRGQASLDFQKEFYGQVKTGTVPEGDAVNLIVTKSFCQVVDELLGGLRSGLTYAGSKSIKEFHRKAEFVEVANSLSYMSESNTRLK